MKVTFKLLAVFLGTTLALLAIEAYVTVLRERTLLDTDLEHEVEAIAGTLKAIYEDVWEREGAARAEELIADIDRRRSGIGIRLVRPDAVPGDELPSENLRLQLRKRQRISFERESRGLKHRVTYVALASQEIALEILQPLSEREAYVHNSLASSVFVALALGGVSLTLFVPLGLKFIGRPLSALIGQARAIGRGDLSRSQLESGHDELSELATAMNLMCDRLEASQQQLRVVTAQRLLAVEKLRRQDRLRTIGQLASEVAHELGTPLNVVSGRAGQIASGRLSAQEAADTAQIIKQQSLRMARIVRQLLDFARPPSLDKSELDLLETARQVISLLEPIARQRHVELRLESAGGVAASADAGRLEQVLVNLLNNAMDAMPRGGTVSVSLHLCESAVKPGSRLQRSNLVRIDVRDQGEGIAEDHLEQLFEPFFTTKEAGHGSGLGLSIAQGIMKEQGGWIEVESERGKGTCFSIYLPAKEERAA